MAGAQDGGSYRCSLGDLARRVEIVYETGSAVPCEVHYYKDTEAPGERQVLWRAGVQSGYCEGRTREFVEQLRGWGWTCEAGAAAPVTDDTETLSAGEPEQ
ncbi:MAG TPA: hypothetical protein VLD39_08860 [Gammaproteobacteria bacterium]|nr:hypothetical protein [Gammaproteobacteria bacterium]